jgi:hypothetical protein
MTVRQSLGNAGERGTLVSASPPPVICTFEDRVALEPGVRLLLLSLERHCPTATVILFATRPATLATLLSSRPHRNLCIQYVEIPESLRGWAVKPYVLLKALESRDQVYWIDTDIIVGRGIDEVLARYPLESLLVAQEPKAEAAIGPEKAIAWGLTPRRKFRTGVNSCFIRARLLHRPLLRAWLEVLTSPSFMAAQELPDFKRPLHAVSDQDVLDALLCSDRFSDVPVEFIRAGSDIAQCFRADGYTTGERLRNLFRRLPPMVHCQGGKTWLRVDQRTLPMDVSPYNAAARDYRDCLSGDTTWMFPRSAIGKMLEVAFAGHPSLTGLPPALYRQISRGVRVRTRLRAVARWVRETVGGG